MANEIGVGNEGIDLDEPMSNGTIVERNTHEDSNGNTDKTTDGVGKESEPVTIEIEEDSTRESWGNKLEFLLATVGFAVGLGNVWRFPYLCQKNGGGAFLIPYFLSLFVIGIPLFLIELGIGQRLRQGAVGAWNEVSPYLGGVGVTSMVVSLFIAIYYNTIVGWCFYYLFISFQDPLPYQDCPTINDNMTVPECQRAGKTSYYWYRKTLDISPSIDTGGGIQWHLALALLLAWLIVYLCTMKGIKSTGKAVYVTALFPYVVLIIFFFRGVTLDGAGEGLKRMFTPKFERLTNAEVWLDAATQIFFSLSLSFGGLIAMASYNAVDNNCKKDAVMISVINCGTSVFASVVVFSILGFKAKSAYTECIEELEKNTTANLSCKSLDDYLSDVAQGTGLSFIAFTEAITKLPAPQVWAVLFFCMLLTLGMGSMFGIVAGVITPIQDMNLVKIRKEYLAAIVYTILYMLGLVLCQRSGEYWLQLLDSNAVNLTLLYIGLFQFIGMNFIYGTERFVDDIEFMTKIRPSWYWIITCRYLGPALSLVLFIAGLVNMGRKGIGYTVWDKDKGTTVPEVEFPGWGYAMVIIFTVLGFIWIPGIALLRFFGLFTYKGKSNDECPDTSAKFNKSISKLALTNINGKPPEGDLNSKL